MTDFRILTFVIDQSQSEQITGTAPFWETPPNVGDFVDLPLPNGKATATYVVERRHWNIHRELCIYVHRVYLERGE